MEIASRRRLVFCGWRCLREDVFDGVVFFDAGETEVEAVDAVGEVFVVEAEGVEDGGLDVVDVDGIFDGVEAEFIGLSVGDAGFDPAAGEPHGEGLGVVVAALGAAERGAGFDHGGASEFAAPDDECVFEEAALFEVGDEGGAGLIGLAALVDEAFFDLGVVVPSGVVDLDEADAALGEAAGEEGVVGEGVFGVAGFGAVEVEGGLAFLGEVHEFGGSGLHAVGHFVGVDACFDFGVEGRVELLLVEIADEVDGIALGFHVEARGIGHVEDGIAGGAEGHALVGGGEETAAPHGGAAGEVASGFEDDEGGEVGGVGADAVAEP